jgi:hypothetical protein
MRTASAVRAVGSTGRVGDAFVLHPVHRPGAGLALTGAELLRLKAVLERFTAASGQEELLGVAEALAGKLDRYFAGLR